MVEMINNFSYNYETDRFEDGQGVALDIVNFEDDLYNVCIFKLSEDGKASSDDILEVKIHTKNYETVVEKIKEFLMTKEYASWRIKQMGWKEAPKIPDAEKFKELLDKSNKAELKYLQNKTEKLEEKTDKLEERITILEDSVEDIQKWRHG
jgi:hypothetical protein